MQSRAPSLRGGPYGAPLCLSVRWTVPLSHARSEHLRACCTKCIEHRANINMCAGYHAQLGVFTCATTAQGHAHAIQAMQRKPTLLRGARLAGFRITGVGSGDYRIGKCLGSQAASTWCGRVQCYGDSRSFVRTSDERSVFLSGSGEVLKR